MLGKVTKIRVSVSQCGKCYTKVLTSKGIYYGSYKHYIKFLARSENRYSTLNSKNLFSETGGESVMVRCRKYTRNNEQ